jgi:hypothetical protein
VEGNSGTHCTRRFSAVALVVITETNNLRDHDRFSHSESPPVFFTVTFVVAAVSHMSQRSAKRRRSRPFPSFGAPSEADLPSVQQATPSSSALSTRTLPFTGVPALTSLCARVFVSNIHYLSDDPTGMLWRTTRRCLKGLPDHLLPKIFTMLKTSYPDDLTDSFITAVGILSMCH